MYFISFKKQLIRFWKASWVIQQMKRSLRLPQTSHNDRTDSPNWSVLSTMKAVWGQQNVHSETENRLYELPDSKVHGATMGPIWGR